MKKIIYILLAVLFLALQTACSSGTGGNAAGQARTVNVFETNGEHSYITRGQNRTTPRAGFRLTDRDVAATGGNSNMFLLLNAESIMKMDERSTVEINRVSPNLLSLTLVEGAIVADIKRESQDDIYEIRVGNVIMGVRGTSFIVEYRDAAPVIVMLEGNGDIDGVTLSAGEIAIIEAAAVSVEPLVLENLDSPFIVGEITRREEITNIYGAGTRIVAVNEGAPHSEASVVIGFDLMELYLNAGLHETITWPADGNYELRLYTGGRISAETFNRGFPFIVYENDWRCPRPGCAMGWMYTFDGDDLIDRSQCLCVNEMEAVMRDWR
jgi:hypothetical protein